MITSATPKNTYDGKCVTKYVTDNLDFGGGIVENLLNKGALTQDIDTRKFSINPETIFAMIKMISRTSTVMNPDSVIKIIDNITRGYCHIKDL